MSGRRDLALLTAGQTVSAAGDFAALIALQLRVSAAGSGWVAALLAAEFVPVIALSLVAGPLVDRFETRRVLLVALVGQAVVAVPLALVSTPLATVLLFAVLASLGALVRPAGAALVPAITGADGAPRGFARIAAAFGIGGIVGPAIGGVLTAAGGPGAAVLVDALSFAALAGLTTLIRARRPRAAAADAAADGWRGGFRIALGHPVLRATQLIAVLGIAFAVIDNVAAPFRIADDLAAGGGGFGVAMTLWSAGALAGTQLLPRLPERLHPAALAGSAVVMGAGIAGIGLAPSVAVAFVAAVIGGIGNGGLNVAQTTVLARFTPEAAHGRAFAAAGAMTQAGILVGTALGAPLTTLLGAGGAMGVAGIATMVAAAGGALTLRTSTASRGPRESITAARRIGA